MANDVSFFFKSVTSSYNTISIYFLLVAISGEVDTRQNAF
jgi:hypothetical protein